MIYIHHTYIQYIYIYYKICFISVYIYNIYVYNTYNIYVKLHREKQIIKYLICYVSYNELHDMVSYDAYTQFCIFCFWLC